MYRGEFLEGEPYEWIAPYRRDYAQRAQVIACPAGDAALKSCDWERAKRFYHFALGRDPTDERAVRGLMRCHAGEGDTNGVRKVYRTLTEALRRELGRRDRARRETTALLEELTGGSEGSG